MKLTLADIAKGLEPRLVQPLAEDGTTRLLAVRPSGARTDSREVKPGDLFFCIKGERADGHDFAGTAVKAGASAIVCERIPAGLEASGTPIFQVKDTVKALGAIAGLHRLSASAKVVGITGTAGKTTVKEALFQILQSAGAAQKNPMNLNNQIGLPLSMLNADADAAFWVMEAGISEARDMDELGAILQPDVGLVLNVGQGHLAGLGDKGTAHYKAKLLDYIRPGGQAVTSGDYPDFTTETEHRRPFFEAQNIRLSRFSAVGAPFADCVASFEGLAECPADGTKGEKGRFTVELDGRAHTIIAPFAGSYGAENVAAIFCAAARLGLSPDTISQAFAEVELPAMRFATEKAGAFILINDSYNSNPLSAGRMVEAAHILSSGYSLPLYLVMGDMLELGEEEKPAHVALGRKIAALSPSRLFWKGEAFEHVGHGLAEGGYQGEYTPVAGAEEFVECLERMDLPGGIILFKGSRSNRLELLVDSFRSWADEKGGTDA